MVSSSSASLLPSYRHVRFPGRAVLSRSCSFFYTDVTNSFLFDHSTLYTHYISSFAKGLRILDTVLEYVI